MKHLRAALPLTFTLVLAACGGTGPTPTPPTETPPVTEPPTTTPPPVTTPPVTTPPVTTPPDTSDDVELVEFEIIDSEFSERGVGIIRNIGESNIELVQLTATFYDSDGQVIASDFGYADLEIIQPGETSPFLILLDESALAYDTYDISAEWFETSEPAIRNIAVTQADLRDDDYSNYLIGQVRNDSSQTLEFVQVVYTCRDADGRLVEANSQYIDADVLAPGATSAYEAFLFADNADECEVVADGQVFD